MDATMAETSFIQDKKKLLRRIAELIFFIFIANSLAMKFYWYSTIWWYDMPMHFLGGFFVALLGLWIYFFSGKKIKNSNAKTVVLISFFTVLVIGILWEVFEFGIDTIITFMPHNRLDTLSDIFYDISGSFAGALYFLKRYLKLTPTP